MLPDNFCTTHHRTYCFCKEVISGKFFMVWSPEGSNPPRVRHTTNEEAVKAAEEMARLHPGQQFYVMQAQSVSKISVVTTTELK